MSDNSKMIRFITSDYNELFQIPNGSSIKIIYPPNDNRDSTTRQCKYIDECHTRIGSEIYHICQFAEIMERIGAKYEPDVQLGNVEIAAFTQGDEKFYTYNREKDNACVGHISGDFGQDGQRFYSNWNNHKTRSEQDWSNTSHEFQTDLQSIIYALRKNLLKDYNSMLSYCENHPEALINSGDTYKQFGFKLETDNRQYYTKCFFANHMRDTRFTIYAYENRMPELQQIKSTDNLTITDEQCQKARNIDLVSFLKDRGYQLVKKGREYHLKEHDSLVISNNLWCWHSQDNIGGDAIDFLTKYENMNFKDAVIALAGSVHSAKQEHIPHQNDSQQHKMKTFQLPEANADNHRVFAYLTKTRAIDNEIITSAMQKGLVYESKDKHNCVFVGYDRGGDAKYASMRGTLTLSDNNFKQDVPGSDKSYGFLMKGYSDKTFVFESAIDALSHASLYKMQGLDWQKDSRISLGGVSEKALDRFLKENDKVNTVELCLDNDKTGGSAAARLGEIYANKGYTVYIDTPKHKDVNQDLIAFKSYAAQKPAAQKNSSKANELCM